MGGAEAECGGRKMSLASCHNYHFVSCICDPFGDEYKDLAVRNSASFASSRIQSEKGFIRSRVYAERQVVPEERFRVVATDASEAAVILLPSNITIFTLDFSGSGLSGGDYVTLGCNELNTMKGNGVITPWRKRRQNTSESNEKTSDKRVVGCYGCRKWLDTIQPILGLSLGFANQGWISTIRRIGLDWIGGQDGKNLVSGRGEGINTKCEFGKKNRFSGFTMRGVNKRDRENGYADKKDDLRAVVDYLRTDGNVSLIGLWGRSMGAVTSLMYGAEDPSIAGMVLDSPFSDLVDLMMELVDTYKVRLPKFTVKFAIQYMRRAIQKKAKFDIMDLNTIKGRWSSIHDVELPDASSHAGRAASSTEDAITQLRSKRPMSTIVVVEAQCNPLVFQVPADISSKDDQLDSQVESRGSDSCPSSSNMISFELSKSSSHVPGLMDDDDEYVEYPLDTLADFPTNVEEEERMFMEAILMSLKDSEVKHLSVDEPSSNGGSELPKPEPAPKNDQDNSFSTLSNSLKTESISTSAADEHKPSSHMPLPDRNKLLSESPPKCNPSSEAETRKTCSLSDTSTCNHSSPNAVTVNSKDCVTVIKDATSNLAAPHPIAEETSLPTSRNDMPSGDQRSSDFDMADRTTVTVKVEKNPTNNILDGLLRRWDLNFFRNR
ncbi:hypothetical protein DH2020_048974 [Rehmannia glutinosa]|uniref:Serine aminopeptidase S33 domain-containing protein n=1 Tax=Rehmannia glutinosa TaxID=99300 RepID=A0ABR0U583_REHGL